MVRFAIISLGGQTSKMIYEEVKKLFDEVDFLDLRKIEIRMGEESEAFYDGKKLKKYDGIYIRGSHKYVLVMHGLSEIYKNRCYLPISSYGHLIAHNKFLTHFLFSQDENLPMPKTYYTAKANDFKKFFKSLNYPIILKVPSGVQGKGVIFSDSYSSAITMIDALNVFNQPILVQEFIDFEKDIRVVVMGDEILGAIERFKEKGEVRSNFHQGGDSKEFLIPLNVKKMCISCAKKLKSEICALDLIITKNNQALILEVNTSVGLVGFSQALKNNSFEKVAKFLYNRTLNFLNSKNKKTGEKVLTDLGVDNVLLKEDIFKSKIDIVNDKIVLPKFVYEKSNFVKGESVIFKIEKSGIKILKK